MLVFYNTALWLAQPFLRRKLARRAQAEPLYGQFVAERFGRYEAQALALSAPRPLWIHAVSLGETRAAGQLIGALRERIPGLPLLLTHGTATGRAEGAKLLQPGDRQCWYPWDTKGAVRRFLRWHRPAMGLLMETEVWPTMVAQCQEMAVPLWLVNARLSAKSQAAVQKGRCLMGPAYQGLSAVLAQTEADAQRLRAVGAHVTEVTGNIKFDARPDAAQRAQGLGWRQAFERQTGKHIAMLASSREGEEAQWLAALRAPVATVGASGAQAPALQWLVVPRHPQRFDEVEGLLRQAGYAVSRRSAWGESGPLGGGCSAAGDARSCIWLGDSMGEMALYYSLAHVALLGGSFAPLGGQNLIEAAACGCPVVLGPHTFNFAQAADDAVAAQAALRVADMPQAVAQAQAVCQAQARWQAMQLAASTFAQQHRGALDRLADAVAQAWWAQAA
ncbi:3-deoxy-D-manno-octulosonic acid transferase [Vandammella animalimorsus]|uniref:3-deoxy-D-manno-octulosonic acid transferase n=1 Tax=Vandammella animalimorsus TaxID=2029117 RepID=A0A2A2ALH1_9BURK|nr:3-deoxy-D-manno-octulosonic acid transferase [Vandammella animalimorsus]PAT38637.1 3-deoxy-D-manno-octulosonic acid transferase [Vandammella animalimorsus]